MIAMRLMVPAESKGYGHHQVTPVQSLCEVLTLISVICPQLYKIRHLVIPS